MVYNVLLLANNSAASKKIVLHSMQLNWCYRIFFSLKKFKSCDRERQETSLQEISIEKNVFQDDLVTPYQISGRSCWYLIVEKLSLSWTNTKVDKFERSINSGQCFQNRTTATSVTVILSKFGSLYHLAPKHSQTMITPHLGKGAETSTSLARPSLLVKSKSRIFFLTKEQSTLPLMQIINCKAINNHLFSQAIILPMTQLIGPLHWWQVLR